MFQKLLYLSVPHVVHLVNLSINLLSKACISLQLIEYAVPTLDAGLLTALISPKDKDEGWFSKENPRSLVCTMEMPADNVTSLHLLLITTTE